MLKSVFVFRGTHNIVPVFARRLDLRFCVDHETQQHVHNPCSGYAENCSGNNKGAEADIVLRCGDSDERDPEPDHDRQGFNEWHRMSIAVHDG